MARARSIGFYREFGNGCENGPSLRECIADTPQPDENKIIEYLENGVGYSGRGEVASQ